MRIPLILFFLAVGPIAHGQSLFESFSADGSGSGPRLSGFIMNSAYLSRGFESSYHCSSLISDLSLKISTAGESNFKGYAEFRYRYGKEFDNRISIPEIREAWVAFYPGQLSFEAGRKIVKWGRTDMFNPLNMVTPANDLVRSYENEDRDLANMIFRTTYSAGGTFSFSALLMPLYRPSVLPLAAMEMPDYTEISEVNLNRADKSYLAIGLRGDLHLRIADISAYYYNGYNKLPGIKLDMLRIPDGTENDSSVLYLSEEPYRMEMLGGEMEGVAGKLGWRWQFSWHRPFDESMQEEHIPFPEFNGVAGVDFSISGAKVTIEYAGKKVINWVEPAVPPAMPGEGDLSQLALLPPVVAEAAVREQIGSFNRLFTYQVERYYHMAGINISPDDIGRTFSPEITATYNFTTHEYLVRPAISLTPYDRVKIRFGAEYWHGDKGSIFNYISDSLTSLWIGIRVDL